MKDTGIFRILFLLLFCYGITQTVVDVADLFGSGFLTWDYIKDSLNFCWDTLSGLHYSFSRDGLFKDIIDLLTEVLDNFIQLIDKGILEWLIAIFS